MELVIIGRFFFRIAPIVRERVALRLIIRGGRTTQAIVGQLGVRFDIRLSECTDAGGMFTCARMAQAKAQHAPRARGRCAIVLAATGSIWWRLSPVATVSFGLWMWATTATVGADTSKGQWGEAAHRQAKWHVLKCAGCTMLAWLSPWRHALGPFESACCFVTMLEEVHLEKSGSSEKKNSNQ